MEENFTPVPEETSELPETAEVVDIQFRPGQKIYFFDPDGISLNPGDHVIMDTARGAEFGTCTAGNHTIPTKDVVVPLRKILRIANAQDEKINEENRARERRAFEVCLQKIDQHNLDMQLVSAECAFDGSKILFYFTADERVDFRDLVKDLASVFHTRIELRQIGVRDKAKMVGGLGICGRPFCCASFLDDFQPVSIKMAKTQNLSLNPVKISGTCGRLMCCLKYEQDTYEDLIRNSPKVDSLVDTPEGRGFVVESEILRGRVKVRMEKDPETINTFSNDDIAILRSGKAKKTDTPIPDDYAPISGAGKRPKKPIENSSEPSMLDPIRFRYSTEAIVDEPAASNPEPEVQQPSTPVTDPKPAEMPSESPKPAKQENTVRPPKPRRDQRQKQPKQEPENTQSQEPEAKQENAPRPPRPKREHHPKHRQNAPEAAENQNTPAKQETPARPPKPRRDQKPKQPEKEAGTQEQPKQGNPQKPPRKQPDKKPAEAQEAPSEQSAENGEQKKPRHHGHYRHHHKPKPKQE